MDITLKSYEYDGKLRKTYKCRGFGLSFGIVRELNEIFDEVESIPNYTDIHLVKVMIAKKDFLPHLLQMMFGIEESELDYIKYDDVINVLYEVIKYSNEVFDLTKN